MQKERVRSEDKPTKKAKLDMFDEECSKSTIVKKVDSKKAKKLRIDLNVVEGHMNFSY